MISSRNTTTEFHPYGSAWFPPIVGLEAAKRALLLLAIEPKLKGILINGPQGSGKTRLLRSFRALLAGAAGPILPAEAMPWVELPLNVTLEQLVGGINIEQTLLTKRACFMPGLLNRAQGGVLHIDNTNLMPAEVINQLFGAIDSTCRPGDSASAATGFLLLGSYDPAAGPLPKGILDRVGLIVTLPEESSSSERVKIMDTELAWEFDLAEQLVESQRELAAQREHILRAQQSLAGVELSPAARAFLCQKAIEWQVEGHRGDLYAQRVARANAALSGRQTVIDDDLEIALRFVLAPRANIQIKSASQPDNDLSEDEDPLLDPTGSDSSSDTRSPGNDPAPYEAGNSGADLPTPMTELRALPPQLDEMMTVDQPINRAKRPRGSIRQRSMRSNTIAAHRGRHIGSVATRPDHRTIDLPATIRTAAPFQFARESSGGARVDIRPSDLKYKIYRQATRELYILVVDASGSMAINRIGQAKGVAVQLLQKAYRGRNKVALITFRGGGAEVILPPSRSTSAVKRALEAQRVGQGTPLAAGLITSLQVALHAREQFQLTPTIILFTDGRANVLLDGQGTGTSQDDERRRTKELTEIGRAFQAESLRSIVIDTQLKFTSTGEALRLARLLGGEYLYLSKTDAALINEGIREILGRSAST